MECYAAGWGKTKTTDSTRVAHQTSITLISRKTCSTIYGSKFDENSMVCTGGLNRPCQGDGGAPLVDIFNKILGNSIVRFQKLWRFFFEKNVMFPIIMAPANFLK